MTWTFLLAIALGGAIGATARFAAVHGISALAGTDWPWGTLVVNVIGGFAIGVLVESLAARFAESPELRGFLITGILGGFTTFSAFSLETIALLQRGALGPAMAYVAASVALSLSATLAGIWSARGLS
jgi:CrcB protein